MTLNSLIVQNDLEEILNNDQINHQAFQDKSILITGASGMIAYYLTGYFVYLVEKKGFKIQIFVLLRNLQKAKKKFAGYIEKPYFHLLVQDVCSPIIIKEDLDYIIHAAGGASPHVIKNDPVGIIKANTLGTINVLNLAREKNSKVLYTSTREVYGEVKTFCKIKEGTFGALDPLDSRSCYPESKRLGEQLLKSYQQQYGINFWSVRIAHAFGPGMNIDDDGRVMADFISDAINNRDIILKSDGSAIRSFCYLTDCIIAILLIMTKGETNMAYNIANESEEYPIREVAKFIISLMDGKNMKVKYCIDNVPNGVYCNYKRVPLDTTKIENLGWKPNVNLLTGIYRTLKSFNDELL